MGGFYTQREVGGFHTQREVGGCYQQGKEGVMHVVCDSMSPVILSIELFLGVCPFFFFFFFLVQLDYNHVCFVQSV